MPSPRSPSPRLLWSPQFSSTYNGNMQEQQRARSGPCRGGLSLEPLIGAIAAGNAVALKPSELAPATARFLEENIGEYLDSTTVKVIQGGPAVGEQLMEHRWDKVLFTGTANQLTGCPRVVMAAAAKHLTPVALELGGKCPCIFDAVAGRRNLQFSVNRVIFAKWSSCAGQACIAIDYVLVEERFAPTLVPTHAFVWWLCKILIRTSL
ncbi:Aldehyde dehydrogenase family 3 member F1 [Hordeum vulgare]|nr:Aldehyde dehydrogenase family 3 member F1 [Hordeum vulgare]